MSYIFINRFKLFFCEGVEEFVKNENKVYSRENLLNQVWGYEYIGEYRTVDVHIKTLRHKLGTAGGQIKTVIGVGYRMEKEV